MKNLAPPYRSTALRDTSAGPIVLALCLAPLLSGGAAAQSTINTGQPTANSNLNSADVRSLAQAAASDINNILGMHGVSALGSCPRTSIVGTDCLVVGSSPYAWFKWFGGATGWGAIGSINPTTGAFSLTVGAPLVINGNTGTPFAPFTGSLCCTTLQSVGADASFNFEIIDAYGHLPSLVGRRANGIRAAPTAVQDGNALLVLGGHGYTGSAMVQYTQVDITLAADQNWTPTATGTAIIGHITENGTTSSSGAALERFRADTNGFRVYMNAMSPPPATIANTLQFIGLDATQTVVDVDSFAGSVTFGGRRADGTLESLIDSFV